ncbi:uncharacterized protein LOC144178491 isoform X2 [Haemaphysalis longicornis]
MLSATAFLLLLTQHVNAYFNLEELRSFNYEVDIVNTPVKIGDDVGPSVMLMTTKFGQEYQCSLPESSFPPEHAESAQTEEEAPNVLKLLEPLRTAPCLTKTRNWWTYEICYGKSIKQFHVENGHPEGAIIFLGLYESDFDWNNETNLEQFNKTGQQKYHSQIYSHGSKCDITGVPRRAEVRYYCDEDSTDYVESVEEPETCSYVFTVHTSRVCAFPPLKRISPTKPYTISCSPRLSEKQYQKHLETREMEKKMEEAQRKRWLLEQQKKLDAIKSLVKDASGNRVSNLEDPLAAEVGEDEKDFGITEAHNQEKHVKNIKKLVIEEVPLGREGGETETDPKNSQPELPTDTKEDEAPAQGDVQNNLAQQFKHLFSQKAEGDLQDEADAQLKESNQADTNAFLGKLIKRLKRLETQLEGQVGQAVRAEGEEGEAAPPQEQTLDDQPTAGGSEPLTQPETPTQELAEGDANGGEGAVIQKIITIPDEEEEGEDYEDNSAYSSEDGQGDAEASRPSGDGDSETQAGRKIEVKIITAGYYNDDNSKTYNILSPEETKQFQNMIVTLLMGNQEAIQEIEKHERLEKNYNFVWNSEETETAAATTTTAEEENNKEEAS